MLAAVWAKKRWTKLGLFVLQLFQLNSCCIGKAIAQPHWKTNCNILYNIYHTRSFPTRRYFSRSTPTFLRATNPGPRNADSQHVRQNHSKFGTTILDARHVLSTPISVFILFTCFRICQISEFVDKMSNDVKWELVWIWDPFVSSIFFLPQRSVLTNLAPTYSNFNWNEKAKWQYFQQSLHFIFTPGPSNMGGTCCSEQQWCSEEFEARNGFPPYSLGPWWSMMLARDK